MNELRKAPKKAKVRIPTRGGGWVEADAIEHPGQTQDPDKVEEAMAKARERDFFKRVGAFTEAINKYVQMYAADHGLSLEEAVAAVYLENCNNRFYYPEDQGGKERFDQVTKEVWEWFKKNATS